MNNIVRTVVVTKNFKLTLAIVPMQFKFLRNSNRIEERESFQELYV